MKKPRILICGGFRKNDFERCWYDWMRDQGYPVMGLDYDQVFVSISNDRRIKSILWHYGRFVLDFYFSRELERQTRGFHPDLIIVVSGRFFKKESLEKIKANQNCRIFHYYGEYLGNPLNTTQCLLNAIPVYDYWFTANKENFKHLDSLPATNMAWVPFGYIPDCHYYQEVTEAERKIFGSDLAFVGTWEKERASVLSELDNFDLKIWGGYWHNLNKKSRLNSCVQNRLVYCDEMSKVFNSSKICLAFLRKANKDLHTNRTFEIPACGGFQLSERTFEVLDFFDEDKEIVCFSDNNELKEKIRYYLTHEEQRANIARAGHMRVMNSQYSFTDRIKTILEYYR